MLIVLCLMAICSRVGAHEYHALTYDEIRDIIDNLQTSAPDEVVYTRYPTSSTTESSTEYWGSEQPQGQSFEESEDEWYTTEPTYEVVTDDEPEETSEEYELSEQRPEEEPDDEYTLHVGSMRGIPGVHFPDYTDIPLTDFQCLDKAYVPGFYADMDTGCQVFHVCWPHRRESFLCPVGTTFNQAILACDYWYSSNCSIAPHYYDVNAESSDVGLDLKKEANVGSMIDSLLDKEPKYPVDTSEDSSYSSEKPRPVDVSYLMKFLPVKARVVVYPETDKSKSKIVAEASIGKSKKRKVPIPPTEEPIYEDIEYTPVHAKPTSVQVQPLYKVVKSKHSKQSTERIIDQVFEIAKRLVKEAEGLIPVFENVEVSRKVKPVGKKYVVVHRPETAWKAAVKPAFHSKRPIPLTKLNPRFITKPVDVKHKKPPLEAPEVKMFVHSRPHARFYVPKAVFSRTSSHKLHVSPLTKNTLSHNYLKLLKIKTG